MRQAVADQLAFMDLAVNGHHCRGTKIIPFSMHNVDEVLDDLELNISRRTRAVHWLGPIKPSAYRKVTPKLTRRIEARVVSSESSVADVLTIVAPGTPSALGTDASAALDLSTQLSPSSSSAQR